jgi:hypothetical protein
MEEDNKAIVITVTCVANGGTIYNVTRSLLFNDELKSEADAYDELMSSISKEFRVETKDMAVMSTVILSRLKRVKS